MEMTYKFPYKESPYIVVPAVRRPMLHTEKTSP